MLKKQQGLLKNRHGRKLEKFSDSFNEIFFFFLKSYRKGLLNFGGDLFFAEFDKDSDSCRETFRKYEDGQFKEKNSQAYKKINSRHPNIVMAVITAKKSWGLNMTMWMEGIRDWLFWPEEILEDFERAGIKIPKSFLKEFWNGVERAKLKRYENLGD